MANYITENNPNAIEMSNAAYGKMFSAARGYPQRKPVGQPAPEGLLGHRLAVEKQHFQKQFDFEWDTVVRRGKERGLDTSQINKALEELSTNAQRKAMELTQRAETQTAGLVEMDQFGKVGGVTPEALTRAKWRMLGGPEADRMIQEPKAEAGKDPIREHGTLNTLRGHLETRLKRYQLHPAGTEITERPWWFDKKKKVSERLLIKDPTLVHYDDNGKPVQGTARQTTPEEIRDYADIQRRIEQVSDQIKVIESGPDFTNRLRFTAGTSGRMAGGPLGDQVKTYMAQRQESQQATGGSDKVRVVSPDGQTGTIDAGEWEQYQAQGFKRVQ